MAVSRELDAHSRLVKSPDYFVKIERAALASGLWGWSVFYQEPVVRLNTHLLCEPAHYSYVVLPSTSERHF